MKHWKPVGMHVLHIVAEMCFWVVEIHVLKKETCLHVWLLLWQGVHFKSECIHISYTFITVNIVAEYMLMWKDLTKFIKVITSK